MHPVSFGILYFIFVCLKIRFRRPFNFLFDQIVIQECVLEFPHVYECSHFLAVMLSSSTPWESFDGKGTWNDFDLFHLLGLVLWPNMWFLLEDVSCALERMCIILLSRKFRLLVRSAWSVVLFKSAICWFSFWMFYTLLKGYWFLHVDLINLFFTKFSYFSNYFSVNILTELWYLIILFVVKDSSTSSFPIHWPLIAFFCLIELVSMFDTISMVIWGTPVFFVSYFWP